MESLRVREFPRDRRNISPGATGQFVVERNGERRLLDGYWSLLIEPRPDGQPGYRPNPEYRTFNARSDRLESSRLWKTKYRKQRAIVPADGFHEWVGRQCYDLVLEGQAIAFGGLYEQWQFGDDVVNSYAIITTPPHPRVRHVHDKSLPLLLEPKDFDAWLDPHFTNVDDFADLLKPVLHHALRVIPVASPGSLAVVGAAEVIEADS